MVRWTLVGTAVLGLLMVGCGSDGSDPNVGSQSDDSTDKTPSWVQTIQAKSGQGVYYCAKGMTDAQIAGEGVGSAGTCAAGDFKKITSIADIGAGTENGVDIAKPATTVTSVTFLVISGGVIGKKVGIYWGGAPLVGDVDSPLTKSVDATKLTWAAFSTNIANGCPFYVSLANGLGFTFPFGDEYVGFLLTTGSTKSCTGTYSAGDFKGDKYNLQINSQCNTPPNIGGGDYCKATRDSQVMPEPTADPGAGAGYVQHCYKNRVVDLVHWGWDCVTATSGCTSNGQGTDTCNGGLGKLIDASSN